MNAIFLQRVCLIIHTAGIPSRLSGSVQVNPTQTSQSQSGLVWLLYLPFTQQDTVSTQSTISDALLMPFSLHKLRIKFAQFYTNGKILSTDVEEYVIKQRKILNHALLCYNSSKEVTTALELIETRAWGLCFLLLIFRALITLFT